MNKPLFLWYGSHCQRDDTLVSTHYSSTLTARVARGLSPENIQYFNSLELALLSANLQSPPGVGLGTDCARAVKVTAGNAETWNWHDASLITTDMRYLQSCTTD